MPWFRNRGEPDSGAASAAIPNGVTHLEAAKQAVAAFLAEQSEGLAGVERVEVVELRSGQFPVTTAVGVALQWRQGADQFGLLMSIERLADQAGDLDGVPFYLRLAVEEPHGGSPEGSPTWFTDLPSGPY